MIQLQHSLPRPKGRA